LLETPCPTACKPLRMRASLRSGRGPSAQARKHEEALAGKASRFGFAATASLAWFWAYFLWSRKSCLPSWMRSLFNRGLSCLISLRALRLPHRLLPRRSLRGEAGCHGEAFPWQVRSSSVSYQWLNLVSGQWIKIVNRTRPH